MPNHSSMESYGPTSSPVLEVLGKIYSGSAGSAGYDLYCHEDVFVEPAPRGYVIDTGVKFTESWTDAGFLGLVVPRSSASKKGLYIANTVGIIDSDYRGNIKVNVMTHNPEGMHIAAGERIAQLIAIPYAPIFSHFLTTNDTVRAEGGFGSTGEK